MEKGKIKIIIQWLAAVLCYIFALAFGFNIFLLLAGFLFMPIVKFRQWILRKLKIRGLYACILAGVMFFVGIFTFGGSVESTDTLSSSSANSESSSVISKDKEGSSSFMESSEIKETVSSEQETDSSSEKYSSSEKVESSNEQIESSEIVESSEIIITYILNINSLKIHKPNCSVLKRTSESNKKETTLSLEELLKKGYKTCGTCF